MSKQLKTSDELAAEGETCHITLKLPRRDADELQRRLRRFGYANRSAWIREAIWQKLRTDDQRERRDRLA
jgi:metal-responsive CopG/Arc/MetJ family transcriptional regulator